MSKRREADVTSGSCDSRLFRFAQLEDSGGDVELTDTQLDQLFAHLLRGFLKLNEEQVTNNIEDGRNGERLSNVEVESIAKTKTVDLEQVVPQLRLKLYWNSILYH